MGFAGRGGIFESQGLKMERKTKGKITKKAVEGAPVTCVLIFTHVSVTATGAFNRIE